jgi:hypothetical protein
MRLALPRPTISGGSVRDPLPCLAWDLLSTGYHWQGELNAMSIPVENVVERKCFRVKDDKPRHVLRVHKGIVTWVPRGDLAWTVLRNYAPVAHFAEQCEAEIDYTTLQDVA